MIKMDNKRGFTLVELLVTMVILGIVTAMSIPLINAIKDANTKRKFETYLNSLTYSSKLYVDSYQEDLFKYQESGCAYIKYSDLKTKLLTKDIEIDNISCDSDESFIKVTKLFDMYHYTPTIGCGEVKNGDVNVTVNYPSKMAMDATCGPDVEKRMTISITPDKSEAITKKKVNMNVKVTSETGFNTQSKISYGFYKVDASHPAKNYSYVDRWYSLSFDIPSKSEQIEIFKNNGSFTLTSKDLITPNGETGKYQLVLRVDFLTDLTGVNWKNDDQSDYIYSGGLYTLDNSAPTVSSFTATSSENSYRSLTPKISVTATDNDTFTSNADLLACYSKDSDTCSKKVSDIKNYGKLSTINNKLVAALASDYDSSNHTLYVTVADKAGNYTTKTVSYQVAQRYRINYDSNGGNACSPTYKTVIYNPEAPGVWGTLCTPTREYYEFTGWNRKQNGTGAVVTANTNCTNAEKTITVYAQWKPHDYAITYNLNGGKVSPANPSKYNIETPTFTLRNPTKLAYDFTGWTGTGLSGKTTTVTIAKGSHGERTYTANWTPHIYSITYNLNGGSVSPANPTSYTIESNTFTLKNPKRNCYNFTGWSGSASGTSVSITKGSYGDKSFTANWAGVAYTISYNGNGNTGGSTSDTSCTYGSNCTVRSNGFSKTGYRFTGWKTSNGTSYSAGQNVTTLSCGGTATLYAQWEPDNYTVTMSTNGGSLDKTSASVAPGGSVTFTATATYTEKYGIGNSDDISVSCNGGSVSKGSISLNGVTSTSIPITVSNVNSNISCSLVIPQCSYYQINDGHYNIFKDISFKSYDSFESKTCFCAVRGWWDKDDKSDKKGYLIMDLPSSKGGFYFKKISFYSPTHHNSSFVSPGSCSKTKFDYH